MKAFSLLVVTVFLACSLFAQRRSGRSDSGHFYWPPKTDPDTVTCYIFEDTTYGVKAFKKIKPKSNYSFKSKMGVVVWMPVKTQGQHIDTLAKSSLGISHRDFAGIVTDTIQCTLFHKKYVAIFRRDKQNRNLIVYQHRDGSQIVFFIEPGNSTKPYDMIHFLEGIFN